MTSSFRQFLCFLLATGGCLPAGAQVTYEVLQEFERPGAQPLAPLHSHPDGNFYGTTVAGGACGQGAVYRLTPAGDLSTLLSFTGPSGPAPGVAPLGILAEGSTGDLFGTTSGGGAGGFGIAFQLTTAGEFTPLLEFTGTTGPTKGSVPGGLVAHPDGTFYGTTQAGGAGGFGTVFRLSPTGTLTTLLEFTGIAGSHPGSAPLGPLAINGTMLYGVTREGGANGEGTAFELTTGGSYRLLANFDGTNGSRPSPLVFHNNGLLYGTAEFGGAFGFGTAFSLGTGSSPALTTLHDFDDPTGSQPVGQLTEAADGTLVGVASLGGNDGWGAVFALDPNGSYTVLDHFTGESGPVPGAEPLAGLSTGAGGELFGVTSAGGPANLGTTFRVGLDRSVTTLANFSLPLGWFPSGAPLPDSATGDPSQGVLFPVAAGGMNGGGALLQLAPGSGAVVAAPLGASLGDAPAGGLVTVGSDAFGVTSSGGGLGCGATFVFSSATGASLVSTHRNSEGAAAEGPLVLGNDGALYGVAREGGTIGQGTTYRLTPAGVRTRLVSFTGSAGSAPGRSPRGPLALAPNGDFYGLAERGGTENAGVLFRISPTGTYTLLHQFSAIGPRLPRGGLILGTGGFLYGTTSAGGASDAGTIIRIDPSNDQWEVVGEFTDASGVAQGRAPAGSLAVGPNGTLYGTTTTGGPAGFGGIFALPSDGPLESLAMFSGEGGSTPGQGEALDGPQRFLGGLTVSPDGVVYGLAPGGGEKGGGVAYRIAPLPPLAQWKELNLGDPDAPDLGDPDFDRVPVLLEYALLLLPQVSDAKNLPQTTVKSYPDGNRLSILVPRDPDRSDVTVWIEASSTLQDPWELLASSSAGQPFSGPGLVGGDSNSPGVKSVEIRDLVPLPDSPRRFLRIRVSRL